VNVPVEGNTAATTTPTADTAKLSETPVKDSQVTKDEDVQKVKDAVKVPEGTKVTEKTLLDGGKVVADETGKLVVKVEVKYEDGSKDVVNVPVEGNTAATTTPTADTAKLSETPVKDSQVTKD
ncbi:Rib/alpha-like domain-containing protein, partial [Streptococcus sp. 4094]|uniref:Rib/alpha-like domain-containing protein n=1 Tax=Streptococcus sp. 4094 TaxID=2582652 RepID=UPI001564DDAA